MTAPIEGVHIVAVWRTGGDGEVVAASGDVSSDYAGGLGRNGDGTGPNVIARRGLYRVTWRSEDDPPEVERIGDLPDVDALCRVVTP